MTAFDEKAGSITSLLDPAFATADVIADAFSRFPESGRPLAAFLFVHLTRIALEPVNADSEGDAARRTLEECRQASVTLRASAEKAELPPFDPEAIGRTARDFTFCEEDALEDFFLPFGMLSALIDLVEQTWGTELVRIAEPFADRRDREGTMALLIAMHLHQQNSVTLDENFPSMNGIAKRAAEGLHAVLGDDDLRRTAFTVTDGLIAVTSAHDVSGFLQENGKEKRRAHGDFVNFLFLFAWACFARLEEDPDACRLAHAAEDAFFFSVEDASSALASKAAEACAALAYDDRRGLAEAWIAEGLLLENLQSVSDFERGFSFGEAGTAKAEQLLCAVRGFILIGRALSGRDDLSLGTTPSKPVLN